MSTAIIYIKSDGDDLTPEQLELLHKYSDQARVWAHLLLTEAGLIGSTEEWRQRRQEWLDLKNKLSGVNSSYADAVNTSLQQQYKSKQDTGSAVLPDPKDFFPPNTPPEELENAKKLAEQVKQDFTDLYPSRREVGWGGPFLTPDEQEDMLRAPNPELVKEWQEKTGVDPSKWSGGGEGAGSSPVIDMAKGFAINKGKEVVDPKTGRTAYNPETREVDEDIVADFAHEVVLRAIKSYNPFKAEDTNTGSKGFEGERATLGTYLYQVMMNEIKSRKDQFARQVDPRKGGGVPLSLSQPMTGEETLSLEETIAERAKTENLFEWESYIEPLQAWLQGKMDRPGSHFTQQSADRLVDLFRRIFVDGEKMSDVARAYGLTVDRPRAKEIAALKRAGVDTSSLPQTLSPGSSQQSDRDARKQLWVDHFALLRDKIKQLQGKEQTPEVAKQLEVLEAKRKSDQKLLDELQGPNTARIQNLIWGKGPHQGPYLMEFLTQYPEISELVADTKKLKRKQALEEFLTSISRLRSEGGLNYDLLRSKIEKRLSAENPQLFKVYTLLYESDFSNPDTAKLMKLSPPRITGLKKKIVSTLLDLQEIQSFLYENEDGTVSPLRRFIFNEGDTVEVLSIKEVGTILGKVGNWYRIQLNNGNEVLTIKEDIQKHSTLMDSARSVMAHYFNREVVAPQCYLSFIAEPSPKLVVLELRPSSEITTIARLHVNNNLVDITEFSEKYPDNLVSVLKGHIGDVCMETPFTPLFEEVGK